MRCQPVDAQEMAFQSAAAYRAWQGNLFLLPVEAGHLSTVLLMLLKGHLAACLSVCPAVHLPVFFSRLLDRRPTPQALAAVHVSSIPYFLGRNKPI
jgi:hypothetical protein